MRNSSMWVMYIYYTFFNKKLDGLNIFFRVSLFETFKEECQQRFNLRNKKGQN